MILDQEVTSATLETKGFGWDNVMSYPHIVLGLPAGPHIVEVEKISPAYIQDASTVVDMQVFECCSADWTGHKSWDRDALIVVDGSAYGAGGFAHILWCCHPRFDAEKKSKIGIL